MKDRDTGPVEREGYTLGIILLVAAVFVLAFAAVMYSAYSHNRDVLEWNKLWDVDTPEMYDIVKTQRTTFIIAFLFGSMALITGIGCIVSSVSYNRRVDHYELLTAIRGVSRAPSREVPRDVHCGACGSALPASFKFCPVCGKRA